MITLITRVITRVITPLAASILMITLITPASRGRRAGARLYARASRACLMIFTVISVITNNRAIRGVITRVITRVISVITIGRKMTNLRESMPLTAAFIDECRAAFGAESVNASIRAGMQGQPTFWASEGGIEIGTKTPEPLRFITADRMVIRTNAPPAMPGRARMTEIWKEKASGAGNRHFLKGKT